MRTNQNHPIASHWDAGTMGCSQLIVGLRRAVAALQDGQYLEVLALDEGAPADIPAWCRMTRHTLIDANHPKYIICKQGDSHV